MKARGKPDPFELDNLRVDPEEVARREAAMRAAPKPAPRPRPKDGFVRLPLSNAVRLGGKASGAAWAVLACLLDLEFQARVKDQPLALTNRALQKWNVSRYRKTRALTELEALGMISVQREPRKAPRIKICCAN
jgi:hypothetical protein